VFISFHPLCSIDLVCLLAKRYDPNADIQAHSSAHKRTVVEHESYLSKDQLRDLRRVQHERVEIAKRKQLGLEVKQSMGVRMDGSMFDE